MKRAAALLIVLLAACNRSEEPSAAATSTAPPPIGNPGRGKLLASQHGCNVCHIVPGVEGPQGSLGPSLAGIATRPTLGNGAAPNTPANLVQYIQQPASLNPASTMPPLGVAPQDAQDIAAYLGTLR
jgi:cytochrome c